MSGFRDRARRGHRWPTALAVAGFLGLAGLVAFAVAALLEDEED